jgi:hypothetical protein
MEQCPTKKIHEELKKKGEIDKDAQKQVLVEARIGCQSPLV